MSNVKLDIQEYTKSANSGLLMYVMNSLGTEDDFYYIPIIMCITSDEISEKGQT